MKNYRRSTACELGYKRMGKIYSLDREGLEVCYAEVTVWQELSFAQLLVEYKGLICSAFVNPINGVLYVDDIYGVVGKVVD